MDDRTRRIVRAIFGLNSPLPAGSQHYRSGWSDGLDAAIDAVKSAVLESGERPASLADTLRGTADRIDAEDLPQTAEDTAVFCDGARWATAQLRQIAEEASAEPAGDATPDWLVDLTRRHAPAALTSDERAMLKYALDLAQEAIWSQGGFTDADQAAVDSLKQLAGEEVS